MRRGGRQGDVAPSGQPCQGRAAAACLRLESAFISHIEGGGIRRIHLAPADASGEIGRDRNIPREAKRKRVGGRAVRKQPLAEVVGEIVRREFGYSRRTPEQFEAAAKLRVKAERRAKKGKNT